MGIEKVTAMGNITFDSGKDHGFLPEEKKELRQDQPDYAGEITPQEAWHILSGRNEAVMVDVRTIPEWSFVGAPDLSALGKEVIFLSWRIYPGMAINSKFCSQFTKAVMNREAPVLFICRSGHRSMDAAIECTRYGYKYCYNITGGFEGGIDIKGHRGNINGWKSFNLPWGQN